MVTNVRTAKAKLSELLDRAAGGEEIVITSDGRPKARLVAVESPRKQYRVNWRLLSARPKKTRTRAEDLVRADRDAGD